MMQPMMAFMPGPGVPPQLDSIPIGEAFMGMIPQQ